MLGPGTPRPRHRRRRPRGETVPTSIRQLLNVLKVPAFVEDRYFDVLAANNLARSLSHCLQVDQNRLRAMSLDPAEKALYPHRGHAARLVPSFREPVGSDADGPRYVQLVGELSLSSGRFRRRWAWHDVQSREGTDPDLPPSRVVDVDIHIAHHAAMPRAAYGTKPTDALVVALVLVFQVHTSVANDNK